MSSTPTAPAAKRLRLSIAELQLLSKEELLEKWAEQDRYMNMLEASHQHEHKNSLELASLRESEEKLKQQQIDSTRRENVLVMRLTAKEQEVQEYINQIQELKQAQLPGSSQLRCTLLDPAVNMMFERMKKELDSTKAKLEETQNDLGAWKFTPDSNTGKRLMAKCRLLYQENEELGKMISSGRIAKLEGDLSLQRNFSEEMKKSQAELDEFLVELDEDVEGMQSTIYYLQQQLKESKEQMATIVTQQQNNQRERPPLSLPESEEPTSRSNTPPSITNGDVDNKRTIEEDEGPTDYVMVAPSNGGEKRKREQSPPPPPPEDDDEGIPSPENVIKSPEPMEEDRTLTPPPPPPPPAVDPRSPVIIYGNHRREVEEAASSSNAYDLTMDASTKVTQLAYGGGVLPYGGDIVVVAPPRTPPQPYSPPPAPDSHRMTPPPIYVPNYSVARSPTPPLNLTAVKVQTTADSSEQIDDDDEDRTEKVPLNLTHHHGGDGVSSNGVSESDRD